MLELFLQMKLAHHRKDSDYKKSLFGLNAYLTKNTVSIMETYHGENKKCKYAFW
jgi:hypothetical protein